jgi:hypothetical protein
MSAFLKGLIAVLYVRVVVHYKYTLLGIALAAGVEVANYLQSQPQPYLHAAATALVLIFGYLKGRIPPEVK